MLKQIIDKNNLIKLITHKDVVRWNLISKYGSIETCSKLIADNLSTKASKNFIIGTKFVKGKKIFYSQNFEDAILIKSLDRFIRNIYKVQQSDRNKIIRQLSLFLSDPGDYYIIRRDLKNCYESINLKAIIKKIENDGILSPKMVGILNIINEHLINNHNMHGLPRGLPISSSLSELYLEMLDKKIKTHPDVIYYARYVDDFVIIIHQKKKEEFSSVVQKMLNELNLNINSSSQKKYDQNTNSVKFEFLGYEISSSLWKKNENNIRLKISETKIKKIKSKIIICLLNFKYDNDFKLLFKRLLYLANLKTIKKNKNGCLLSGLAYNYQYITDKTELTKLDNFFQNQISSRNIGLKKEQIHKLRCISFYLNFNNKSTVRFSKLDIRRIKRIWKNV